VLVPLIKQKLQEVASAGLEYQRQTGDLLIEAKDQVPLGSWGAWLNRNFHLSARTAREYMQLARKMDVSDNGDARRRVEVSKHELLGAKARRDVWQPLLEATREVDVETVAQERQSRVDEIKLHRDLALELIDIGYKALATRLHPDRGGSKDAMSRLNRVRDELNEVAGNRRYV
jgi:hypothetical protein